ncbi:MAG: hypothetical protein ABI333_16490 [bacterium]
MSSNPRPARAPGKPVVGKPKPKRKERAPDGWFPAIIGALNFSFTYSDGTVGTVDGVGVSLGITLDADLTFRRGHHEWINRLQVNHLQTLSTTVKRFVKSVDYLQLQTLYQFRLPTFHRLGVFALLRVTSELFSGYLIRKKATTLEVHEVDGASHTQELAAQTPHRLTGPFLPLFFKQMAGLVLWPLERRDLVLHLRVGASALQAWTGGGILADDDVKTEDVYELVQLRDFQQFGVEAHVGLRGTAVRKILSYELLAELMYPFATMVPTTLSGVGLFNVELRLNVGIKINSWLSLTYSLSAIRIPLLLAEWQVVNNIMLSFTASWIPGDKP